MVKLSVEISDFIAADFEGKLLAARELGIHNLEIGDVIDDVRIDTMTGAQLERVRNLLIDHNIRIVLISVTVPLHDQDAMNRLFRSALQLDAEALRIRPAVGPAVDENMDFVKKLSRSYSIPLYVENCADGPFPDEDSMLQAVKTLGVKIIFNPLEITRTDRHPFFHAFTNGKIKNDIGFLRICDGLYRVHEPVALGHGCAEVKELTSILLCRSFSGYFSFIPYMPQMGMEEYRMNIDTFKKLLKHM